MPHCPLFVLLQGGQTRVRSRVQMYLITQQSDRHQRCNGALESPTEAQPSGSPAASGVICPGYSLPSYLMFSRRVTLPPLPCIFSGLPFPSTPFASSLPPIQPPTFCGSLLSPSIVRLFFFHPFPEICLILPFAWSSIGFWGLKSKNQVGQTCRRAGVGASGQAEEGE